MQARVSLTTIGCAVSELLVSLFCCHQHQHYQVVSSYVCEDSSGPIHSATSKTLATVGAANLNHDTFLHVTVTTLWVIAAPRSFFPLGTVRPGSHYTKMCTAGLARDSQTCLSHETVEQLRERCVAPGAARDALVAQSKAHLEVLEVQRKLYLRSRSLSLAQRALLYAHDELDMSMMRMQLRAPGQAVKPHEQHFRLQPFEVPLKNRVGLQPSTPCPHTWGGIHLLACCLLQISKRMTVRPFIGRWLLFMIRQLDMCMKGLRGQWCQHQAG